VTAAPDSADTDTGAGAACPCGAGPAYDRCCGRFHRGEARPATAEQLMRSRYAAFAVGDPSYLEATWHPSSRPRRVRVDPDRRWVGLDVLATEGGGMLARDGTVEFVARHEQAGRRGELHEVSAFVRVDGHWAYLGPAPGT
jgi:SEC-C motif-containing protein